MKSLAAALALLILILILNTVFYGYLKNTMDELAGQADELIELIRAEREAEGSRLFYNLHSRWNKTEKRLRAQTEHAELDLINDLFAELDACFTEGDMSDFYSAAYKLRMYFSHLVTKNQVNMSNIL